MLESVFNKTAGLRSETLLKKDSNTVVSFEIKSTYFDDNLRTAASAVNNSVSFLVPFFIIFFFFLFFFIRYSGFHLPVLFTLLILKQCADDLFECVLPFGGVGA